MDRNSILRIVIAVCVAVVLFMVLRFFNMRTNVEGMENHNVKVTENDMKVGVNATSGPGTTMSNSSHGVNNQELIGESKQSLYSQSTDPGVQAIRGKNCWPKEQLTPNELLPQDNSTAWAQVNPEGSGTLKDRNFLQAGHHIGINTVGQTLRNANLQLRSEPPNPQVKVSPWIQSTIQPDTNRKPLEIGGCN